MHLRVKGLVLPKFSSITHLVMDSDNFEIPEIIILHLLKENI